MPQISRTALVPYSAEQMYQLVNDVQSYPQFLPGCTGSRVLESTPGQMTAAVDVSKAGISKTFTTRNQLTSNQSILMHLVDGPFKKLIGGWTTRKNGPNGAGDTQKTPPDSLTRKSVWTPWSGCSWKRQVTVQVSVAICASRKL